MRGWMRKKEPGRERWRIKLVSSKWMMQAALTLISRSGLVLGLGLRWRLTTHTRAHTYGREYTQTFSLHIHRDRKDAASGKGKKWELEGLKAQGHKDKAQGTRHRAAVRPRRDTRTGIDR